MNIVEQAIEREGGQVKLAEKLSTITGHLYTQPHISNWKKTGHFPADVAHVVAGHIFGNDVSALEVCPLLKRAVNAA